MPKAFINGKSEWKIHLEQKVLKNGRFEQSKSIKQASVKNEKHEFNLIK